MWDKLILAALGAALVVGVIRWWWNAPKTAERDGTEPWKKTGRFDNPADWY